MKEVRCIILLLLLSIFPLYSMSIQNKQLSDPFDSQEELLNFQKDNLLSDNVLDFLDNTSIYLVSISEGKPLYSWFGHSAILIESPRGNIVYDYGVFTFSAEHFYWNFIQGKMYYRLALSEKNLRLQVAKDEDRTIKEIKLDLTNDQKANVIQFLLYNAQEGNHTYLYDFFDDNCATRIRDIFDWSTDGDFKNWAENQKSAGTFRELSSNVLNHNLLVSWILNSFLGHKADVENTAWDDMFLPKYLEQYIIDYKKFGTNENIYYQRQSKKLFTTANTYNSNILLYSIIAVVLAGISFFLKRGKQIRNQSYYGIFNLIITLFLFVISCCITFLSFFSYINAAWFNENIIFLNPISTLLLFIFSIKLIKTKKPVKTLRIFERLSRLYSHSILLLIALKLIFNDTFYQNNYNIFIPILLYFAVQGFVNRTHKD